MSLHIRSKYRSFGFGEHFVRHFPHPPLVDDGGGSCVSAEGKLFFVESVLKLIHSLPLLMFDARL